MECVCKDSSVIQVDLSVSYPLASVRVGTYPREFCSNTYNLLVVRRKS